MKKLTLLSLALLFFSLSWGQKIRVSESRENIAGGKNNALVVPIYGADVKDVEHEWKSMMKDYDAKVSNEKHGIMFADNAVIKDMGNNTIDIYARFDENKDEIDLVVAFDLGGAFLSSSGQPDKYKVAEKMLHDFSVKMTSEALAVQLKAQQKILDKLNGQEEDLQKENKNLNSDITDYQDRIKKDQDDLEKNKDEQSKKQTEITSQQQVVDDLNKKAKDVK